MTRACKLNCTVTAGMFANEYMAKVQSINLNGEQKAVHLFVNEHCLENVKVNSKREGSALLRAVKVSQSPAGIGVVLPQATFENGTSLLVPKGVVSK